MTSTKRMLRWASAIMLALGAGHLTLTVLLSWEGMASWVERGVWAAVPLTLSGWESDLQNKVTFWAGPGGFAVPLIFLGCLVWLLAGRGVAVPAALGWGIAAWCAVGGVLLVPSPFFAGIISGALIICAARVVDGEVQRGDA